MHAEQSDGKLRENEKELSRLVDEDNYLKLGQKDLVRKLENMQLISKTRTKENPQKPDSSDKMGKVINTNDMKKRKKGYENGRRKIDNWQVKHVKRLEKKRKKEAK